MTRYLILKLDSKREEKGKHGKFENLYLGPFQIVAIQDNNTYELVQLDDGMFGIPINGKFLKHILH
jgi:hypothetical protein